MPSYAKYKKHWEQKAAEEAAVLEKLRQKALRECERLKDILVKEFNVSKVVVFGSVLREGGLKEDSDIDLAVAGLAKARYFEAVGRLLMASDFEVDLKPIEDVTDLMRERIAKGKVLYEKGKNY